MIGQYHPFVYTQFPALGDDMIIVAALPAANSATQTQFYRLSTNNQIYYSNGTDWRALTLSNSIDVPPQSPHVDNDEFDYNPINPSWTVQQENSPTVSLNSAIPSHYVVHTTTSSNSVILQKTITVSGDATWLVKWGAMPTTNFCRVVIGIYTNIGTNGMFVDYVLNASTHFRLVSKDAGVDTVRAQTTGIELYHDRAYVYLRRVGDVWSFAHSFSGDSFYEHPTTHSKAFTPAMLELIFDSDSQTTPVRLSCDYVRRDSMTL